MFPALNMELEIVRTVLMNPVNDIYVCTDLRKNTGTFYTMVSIADPDCRRKVTEKLNTERLFFSNRDFIGSFIYESRLNLVFRYYHENLLSLLGGVYLVEFADCKRAALGLIAACAECGAGADMGVLLLNDRNIILPGREKFSSIIFWIFPSGSRESKNSDITRRWHRKYLAFWS